jgi:hypothetical protein
MIGASPSLPPANCATFARRSRTASAPPIPGSLQGKLPCQHSQAEAPDRARLTKRMGGKDSNLRPTDYESDWNPSIEVNLAR